MVAPLSLTDPTEVGPHHLASEFLRQGPARRLQLLQQMGLGRFAPILTQLIPTEANQRCLLSFLSAPNRVKFPNLSGADLQGLDLAGVNLIRAKLTQARLQGCNLQDADLIFADLRGADLSQADLRGATLNQTQWHSAQVQGCQFGIGLGLDPQLRNQLQHQGGIFT